MAWPSFGWNRLVDTLALPPAWLQSGLRGHGRLLASGRPIYYNTIGEFVTAALIAVLWGMVFLRCVRRHDRRLMTLGMVTLAVVAGAVVASSAMPDDVGRARIWGVVGMFIWLLPVLVATEWAGAALARARSRQMGSGQRVAAVALAGLATIVPLGLVLYRSSPANDTSSSGYGVVWQFAAVGAPLCKGSSTPVEVRQASSDVTLTALGVIARLQILGCHVHVEDDLRSELPGAWFARTGREQVVLALSASATPPPGFRRLSAYDPANPPAGYRGFKRVFLLAQTNAPTYLYMSGA